MMIKQLVMIATAIVLTLLMACGPATPVSTPILPLASTPAVQSPQSSLESRLTPNPVETEKPIYGGILKQGGWQLRSFDTHQLVGYGPAETMPTFNQLVMFSLDYKECVLENIVGDLAESWEFNQDGTEVTFKLHHGVKWHDGIPFTADDVVYSLDKMTDVNRSVIYDWFPAYQGSERIDDYTVKVHLKYPSAGFMISLAQGESTIQAKHLAGTDDQSADFMVGTGPFILEDYLVSVHMKWKRNPDYFKKDKYGNQLPYLDGIIIYLTTNTTMNEMLIGRRLDMKSTTSGAATLDTYETLKNGAPELLWQTRNRDGNQCVIFLNVNHKPLDDIRVRRAFALVAQEKDLIIGYSGTDLFGITDTGILSPSCGLPKEEIIKLMGWDKSWDARVAEAQRLMAEAGYTNGFKLNMLSLQGVTQTHGGASLVLANELHNRLFVDATMLSGIAQTDVFSRLERDNYDTYTIDISRVGQDPVFLRDYFGTEGKSNWSHYSNPELDKLLNGLDQIIDPTKRQETIWEIERILLTDLPAIPTGCFIANLMPYYPQLRNMRWNNLTYGAVSRLEDVWIDESLRVK